MTDDQPVETEYTTEQSNADLAAIFAAANRELLDYVRARIGTGPRPRPAGRAGHRAGCDEHACQTGGRDVDLDLALELSLQLTRAIDVSLDLALAIPGGGEFDHARALARTLTADLAAARDFEPDESSAATFEFALDVAPESRNAADWGTRLEAARVAGRSRLLDFARMIAHRLTRMLVADEAAGLARTTEWMLDRARDLELGRAITCRIEGIAYIDASAADLSRLRLCAASLPVGTRWSDQTVWPTCIAAEIRGLSQEVRPGTYRIAAMQE